MKHVLVSVVSIVAATRWRVMQQKTVSGSGVSHVEQQIKAETSHGAQEGRRA